MKEQSVTTLSFRKSPGGFQVLLTFKGVWGDGSEPHTFTGVLNNGREMTAGSALRYARRYAAFRKGLLGSFVIDESGLTEND